MSQNLFLKTKPSKLFWMAAIPGGISMLASSLYTVFDSIFVGKFLGTTAFAALGLAMPIIVMNFALAEMVGVGSSVPISILLGKMEDEKANNVFSCSILLTIMMGILSGTFIFFGAPALMRMMGAEDKLLELGVKYIRIYAVFSPLTPLMFSLDNYLRISGKMKTSMAFNIVSSLLVIGLELLLILVVPMGIVGAALASNIAFTICVLIILALFAKNKYQLKYVKPKFTKEVIMQIYKNGIAPFLTNVSGRVFAVVMNIMLLKFGGEPAVVVYGVIMTLSSIVEQLMYGMIDSIQPSIGYNYGAERFDRVKALERYILIVSAVLSVAFGGIIFIFPEAFSIPFLQDLSLLDMTVFGVKIACVTYLFKWFGTAIQCFFMALERPAPATILSIASACVFPLVLIPILLPFELTGLWWNYPLAAVLTAVMALVTLGIYRKKLFVATGKEQQFTEENNK